MDDGSGSLKLVGRKAEYLDFKNKISYNKV